MGEDTEYKPSEDEFLATGLFGAGLYVVLATVVLHTLSKTPSNPSTKLFFILMLLMCIFEVPRFLVIAIKMEYSSRSLYIVHIFSAIFFFAAFSVVCVQWSGLLKLGTYVSVMYSMPGLLIANALFGVCDVAAMIVCGQSHSLRGFFESSYFEAYTFIDTLKNLFYSGLLAFYGIKLILKFYRYSSIELSERLFSDRDTTASSPHTADYHGGVSGGGSKANSVFSTALTRLTVVLTTATICFFVRVFMLILKTAALHSNTTVSTPTAPLFGFLWFCASDFIPRCVPSFAFVYLMRGKKKHVRRDYSTASNRSGGFTSRRSLATSLDPYSGRFTYVGAEDPDGYDDSESEYSNSTGAESYGWGVTYGDNEDAESETIKPYQHFEEEFNDDDEEDEEVVYLDSAVSRRHYALQAHHRTGGDGNHMHGGGPSLVPLGTISANKRSQPLHPQEPQSQPHGGRGGDSDMRHTRNLKASSVGASTATSSDASTPTTTGRPRPSAVSDEQSLTSFTSLKQLASSSPSALSSASPRGTATATAAATSSSHTTASNDSIPYPPQSAPAHNFL